MKNPKTVLIISIVIIVLGLIAFAGSKIPGIILLVVGVYFLTQSLKARKAAQPVQELPEKSGPVNDEKDDGENIIVAGTSFRQDVLKSFGTLNPNYQLTKEEIIDRGLNDQMIYEHTFEKLPAEFRPEPENEHDPNAIAIYVEGKQIGYVKKGSTSHIRKLIESGRLANAVCTISGGNWKAYWADMEQFETDGRDFSAKVHLTLKDT